MANTHHPLLPLLRKKAVAKIKDDKQRKKELEQKLVVDCEWGVGGGEGWRAADR